MPITESDIAVLLPPEESFISRYVLYGSERTNAHIGFHYISALALLAAIVPPTLLCDELQGDTRFANFFGMLVGSAGVSRKTTCVKIARSMLAAVAPERCGTTEGSAPGMVRALAEVPTQCMFVPEGGELFANTEGAMGGVNYLGQIKPFLTGLFDCVPINRNLSKERVRCLQPRASLLCGVNASLLGRHTEPTDWAGGFMSRWFILHLEPERGDFKGLRTHGLHEELVAWLTENLDAPVGRCLGLTPEAQNIWDDFMRSNDERAKQSVRQGDRAVSGRIDTHAIKIMLLVCFDLGIAREGDFLIPRSVAEQAIAAAQLHYMSSIELAALAFPSRDMRARAAVLALIPEDGTEVPYFMVVRDAQMLLRPVNQIIETLIVERTIQLRSIGENVFLSRRFDSEEADEPPDSNAVIPMLRPPMRASEAVALMRLPVDPWEGAPDDEAEAAR